MNEGRFRKTVIDGLPGWGMAVENSAGPGTPDIWWQDEPPLPPSTAVLRAMGMGRLPAGCAWIETKILREGDEWGRLKLRREQLAWLGQYHKAPRAVPAFVLALDVYGDDMVLWRGEKVLDIYIDSEQGEGRMRDLWRGQAREIIPMKESRRWEWLHRALIN